MLLVVGCWLWFDSRLSLLLDMEQHERDWAKFFFEMMIELNRIDRMSYVCRHVFGWDIIINTLDQMVKRCYEVVIVTWQVPQRRITVSQIVSWN